MSYKPCVAPSDAAKVHVSAQSLSPTTNSRTFSSSVSQGETKAFIVFGGFLGKLCRAANNCATAKATQRSLCFALLALFFEPYFKPTFTSYASYGDFKQGKLIFNDRKQVKSSSEHSRSFPLSCSDEASVAGDPSAVAVSSGSSNSSLTTR